MPDPSRNVVCLFGLPFDVVTMEETVRRVRDAVRSRRRLFLSTPNLNFLVGCQEDAAFRRSVIDSDLSVADGMPLVWMSRMLGVPLPERVTGSGLFEALWRAPSPPGEAPVRVYFFGGPPGAAEAAARRLNAGAGGLVCVGHASPGFGSVDELSGQDVIDRINASGADFLVVALGAAKGQAWIRRNHARLAVPVVSHLGAVVNFAAGTVSRAPVWVQRAGLEWLWRIKEEPALWRRYRRDASALLGLFAGTLLPQMAWRRLHRPAEGDAPPTVTLSRDAHRCSVAVRGKVPDAVPQRIRAALQRAGQLGTDVRLDLSRVDYFGPGFAGLLLMLDKALSARGRRLEVVGLQAATRRLLRWHRLDALLLRGDGLAGEAATA